jgi:hypothetical protein
MLQVPVGAMPSWKAPEPAMSIFCKYAAIDPTSETFHTPAGGEFADLPGAFGGSDTNMAPKDAPVMKGEPLPKDTGFS